MELFLYWAAGFCGGALVVLFGHISWLKGRLGPLRWAALVEWLEQADTYRGAK